MDYFSKFLRSTGGQPSPKPIHDYAGEFNISWNLIKSTLEHPDERQLLKGIKSTDVPAHLQSMVDALVWESSRSEEGVTGACLEYLLKNDVLGTLVRLSEPDRPSGIQAEVLRAVQNMVILMDEQFLVHSAVHRAVLRLLRNCVGDDIQEQLDGRHKVMGAAKNAVRSQPSEYEVDLDGDFSEVLGAGLGAVYSLLPSKLEIRSPKNSDTSQKGGMVLGSAGQKHGGDPDAAAEKGAAPGLEDSNNPDFKSRLDHFLKLLEFLQDIVRRNVYNDSPEKELDASGLVGASIVQSVLDAVRRIFLENVLYPSILECSDVDGSAVAVMSYVDIMIRTLEDSPLSDLLVDFLMTEDNDDINNQHSLGVPGVGAIPPLSKSAAAVDKRVRLHRRKSSAMMLLELEAPDSRRPSEYFTSMGRFTLKDLLLSNLRSRNQPTVTAALQLFQTMVSRRCHATTDYLLLVIPDANATSFPEPAMTIPVLLPPHNSREDSDDEEFVYPGAEVESKPVVPVPLSIYVQPDTTYTTHEREMDLYLALVSRLDPSHNEDVFSTGYEHYLRDALATSQHHPCFRVDYDELPETRSKRRHRLNANDPILSAILECLRRFFANSPKTNISLTGVLAELALCPDRSIAGWLTPIPGSPSSPQPATPPRPKSKSRNSLVSFLTPRKSKPKTQGTPEPQTPLQNEGKTTVLSNPFAPHYQRTTDIILEPLIAPLPSSTLWTSTQSSSWTVDEEDVFTDSHWGGQKSSVQEEVVERPPAQVTLSYILDNVVILEECIKELVAIVQARRSLGIDPLRYV
ncbi:hypothetical protein ID866_3724 [Astraeus odoratus]|nr:hypothetical protein ID866_3724 [Astraeus odoratus]